MEMSSLSESALAASLAEWAWRNDPSPHVTPSTCLDSLPLVTAPCLGRLVARAVGIGIILLSLLSRAPVIRNMLSSRSAAGLSMYASYGDLVMYSNAALYNILRGNPFTSYGDAFSLLVQMMVVISLIWRYSKVGGTEIALALAGYTVYLVVVLGVLTAETHYLLMIGQPFVLAYSRGAQIVQNYVTKQTGIQSIATVSMSIFRSSLRIATTVKEVGWDFNIIRGYGASVFLNGTLLTQLLIYGPNSENLGKRFDDKKRE